MKKKLAPGEKIHAKYSASGSERWMNCPGSIEMSRGMPSLDTEASKEGTRAHAVLEIILKARIAGTMTETQLKKLRRDYTQEMVTHALTASDYILNEADKYKGAELLCETECRYDHIEPGQFGTTDAAIVQLWGTLVVIDYKFGVWVVEPKENTQLILYAIGIAHKHGYCFDRVILVVIQPRGLHSDGETIRTWETTIDELILWEKKFHPAIARTKKKEAPLHADKDWCHFCPGQIKCPEVSEKAFQDAEIAFEGVEVQLPAVTTISDLKLVKMLKAASLIDGYLKAVKRHAFDRLVRGEKIPGYKLVEKRGRRKWVDEFVTMCEAQLMFGDEVMDVSLKSPAQFEKLGKEAKQFTKDNSQSFSSGYSIAPESDRRRAVSTIEADFAEISVEDMDMD